MALNDFLSRAWRVCPGLAALLCFAAGIALAAYFPAEPVLAARTIFLLKAAGWVGALLAPVAVLGGLGWFRLRSRPGGAVWAVGLIMAGILLYAGAEGKVMAPFLPLWAGPSPAGDADFEPRSVAFTGTVVGLAAVREDRSDMVVRVVKALPGSRAPAAGALVLAKVRPAVEGFRHGDRVAVVGSLTIPHSPGNPGEFDYRRFLLRRGIGAVLTGRVLPEAMPDGPVGFRHWPVRLAINVRERVDHALGDSFPAGRQAELALVRGILFGDTNGLPPEVAKEFREAGVYHILAVSGSNVAFLVASWYSLFGMLVRRKEWWARGWASRLRAGGGLVIVCAYAVMTGAGPSVARASLMAFFWLAGQVVGRKPEVWNSLGLAGFMVLLPAPVTLFDPGFQLSFVATAGIVAWSRPIADRLPKGRGRWQWLDGYRLTAAASLAAQLATWPVSSFHFGRVPLLGLPANLLVVPVAGWLVTGGAAAGMAAFALPLVGQLLCQMNYVLAAVLIRWTSAWGALPGASVAVTAPPLLLIGAYYLATAALFLRHPWSPGTVRARAAAVWASLAVTAVLVWWGLVPAWKGGNLTVTFLDVGQGDAVLIRSPHGRVALIDAGPPDAEEGGGAGEATGGGSPGKLASLLRRLGVRRLDWVLLTHDHDDHTGGLDDCLRHFRVGIVLVEEGQREALVGKHALLGRGQIRVEPVRYGQELQWDGACLEILWPPVTVRPSPSTTSGAGNPEGDAGLNDRSVVSRLTYGRAAFLFSGDAGAETERALSRWNRAGWLSVRADVLKVGHHGSAASSGVDFLRLVGANAAVVSVGRNVFGHPAPDILSRLAENGAGVWRTDRSGAVTVLTDGRYLVTTGFRRQTPSLAATAQDKPPGSKN